MLLPPQEKAVTGTRVPTLFIQGSPEEFAILKEHLEDLAILSYWNMRSFEELSHLHEEIQTEGLPALLILGFSQAYNLFSHRLLLPLEDAPRESIHSYYHRVTPIRPWRKNQGIVLAKGEFEEEARELFFLLRSVLGDEEKSPLFR